MTDRVARDACPTGLARCRAGGCCSRRGARPRDNLARRPHQPLICEVCPGGLSGCHHSGTPLLSRAQPVVAFVREWPRSSLGQGRTLLHRSRGRCRPGARRLTRCGKASANPEDASEVAPVNSGLRLWHRRPSTPTAAHGRRSQPNGTCLPPARVKAAQVACGPDGRRWEAGLGCSRGKHEPRGVERAECAGGGSTGRRHLGQGCTAQPLPR